MHPHRTARHDLFQLTILAAPPVDPVMRGPAVTVRLASDTRSHTRQRLPTRNRNILAAILAMNLTRPSRYVRPSTLHGVCYRIVDLILNRPIRGPSGRHAVYPAL